MKTKCTRRQEFVIGGFTDPEGSRAGIGALLLGVHDHAGALVFAGKVGTGFTQKSAQEMRWRLDTLEQNECPFGARPQGSLGRNAHWVKPTLVAEVAFSEWTHDGKIRQPSFRGLRTDKPHSEIRREEAAAANASVLSQRFAEYLITSPPPSPGRRGSKKVPLSLRERVRVRG